MFSILRSWLASLWFRPRLAPAYARIRTARELEAERRAILANRRW